MGCVKVSTYTYCIVYGCKVPTSRVSYPWHLVAHIGGVLEACRPAWQVYCHGASVVCGHGSGVLSCLHPWYSDVTLTLAVRAASATASIKCSGCLTSLLHTLVVVWRAEYSDSSSTVQ